MNNCGINSLKINPIKKRGAWSYMGKINQIQQRLRELDGGEFRDELRNPGHPFIL
jgi:hypothetical protein